MKFEIFIFLWKKGWEFSTFANSETNWKGIFSMIILSLSEGSVAEWLGRGLQNLVQRFESARNLILV